MAGRCISVTHKALGTTRVMQTCGMMGEVVGKAASVAIRNHETPRGVYENHWAELADLLRLPGKAHRETPSAPLEIPEDSMHRAGLPRSSNRHRPSGPRAEAISHCSR